MNLAVLSRETGKALKMKGQTLATAESCTGGWVAQAVTSVAGSSEWFERGYVTYSNAAKRESLGVPKKTLLRYGAVSEPTAREMAPGKPVGTVCFAWAQGRRVRAETRRFKGGRSSVRRQSVIHALRGVLKVLKWL